MLSSSARLARMMSLTSKNLVKVIHDFFVNVSFVRTKSTSKRLWDVQEFMYYRLLFSFFGQPVVTFRDYLDHVGRWKVQGLLPYFAKPVNASDSTFGGGSFTSQAENILRDNVEELKLFSNFVGKFLHVRGFTVGYGQLFHSYFCLGFCLILLLHLRVKLAAARNTALIIKDVPSNISIIAQNSNHFALSMSQV